MSDEARENPYAPGPYNQQSSREQALSPEMLKTLSNENENLRETVAELSRTVRELAQQQQDDTARQKEKEEKYREELEGLRANQQRWTQTQTNRTRPLEQV